MFDEKCKHHDECGYDFCHGEGVCEDFRGKSKLLPCPFCGGRQKLQKDTEDYSDRHKMAIAWNALSATFNTGMIAIMGKIPNTRSR